MPVWKGGVVRKDRGGRESGSCSHPRSDRDQGEINIQKIRRMPTGKRKNKLLNGLNGEQAQTDTMHVVEQVPEGVNLPPSATSTDALLEKYLAYRLKQKKGLTRQARLVEIHSKT